MWFFKGEGDNGKTTLKGRTRFFKDEPVFELIGTLDELSANIGMAVSHCAGTDLCQDLQSIQTLLSDLMGVIAGIHGSQKEASSKLLKYVEWIEEKLRYYGEDQLNPQEFVFPGKSTTGASIDICRTITRRAERAAVGLSRELEQFDMNILAVLNRLSSLFFLMRLWVDKE